MRCPQPEFAAVRRGHVGKPPYEHQARAGDQLSGERSILTPYPADLDGRSICVDLCGSAGE